MTLMWLFIEGQTDPIPGAERVPGEAVGDYWYNLETGATVFISAERDANETQNTGRLRVWATTPGNHDRPVEITKRFVGDDSRYVESGNSDRNRGGKLKAIADTLNKELGIDEDKS